MCKLNTVLHRTSNFKTSNFNNYKILSLQTNSTPWILSFDGINYHCETGSKNILNFKVQLELQIKLVEVSMYTFCLHSLILKVDLINKFRRSLHLHNSCFIVSSLQYIWAGFCMMFIFSVVCIMCILKWMNHFMYSTFIYIVGTIRVCVCVWFWGIELKAMNFTRRIFEKKILFYVNCKELMDSPIRFSYKLKLKLKIVDLQQFAQLREFVCFFVVASSIVY